MSVLLFAVAASAMIAPKANPGLSVAVPQGVTRYEYWLYPPGIAPGGRQRWGVITYPSADEARAELDARQASQRLWWTWVGAKNDSSDDPFSYDNFMGPVEVKKSPFPVANGITTANVWIVSLEEVAARKRARAELAKLRGQLENAKKELDLLMPIGTNPRAAADLRGRALYMAAPLVTAMSKVREAEATLQSAHGYTLADLAREIELVNQQLRLLIPTVGTDDSEAPAADDLSAKTTKTTKPTKSPSGPTTLIPTGGGADSSPTTQSPTVLVPGGLGSPTTGAANSTPSTTKAVISELNRLLGSPFPGRNGDDTLFAYNFDREGFTIRTQTYNGTRFLPGPPERIAFAAIGDPTQLFAYKADRQSIAYGDPDTTKFQFRPIVTLPIGTTEETSKLVLNLLQHLVAPDQVPANLPASAVEVAKPSAPSEQEANARMDSALSGIFALHSIDPKELVPTVIPDWLRDHLIARSTYDTGALASYYSEYLAEGGQTLDSTNAPAPLEKIAEIITGAEFRSGDIDRALWTVSSYEERNGAMTLTVQASYVGASAASATDRAVHGVKLVETWAVGANGAPVLNQVRILRPGTVYRPVPPSPEEFAERHLKEAADLLSDGRPQAALVAFDSALRLHPEKAQYWSQYAVAQFQLGQNQEALASYRLARDLDPKNSTIIANYATVLRAIGDFPTAIAAGKQAVEVDPTGVWPRESYALALFEARDFAAAATEYAEAVKLAPDDARLRANYASALLRANRKEEALTEAKAAYAAGFRNHWVFQELRISG